MAASRSRKPNLLIIQSDSMDGRAMGCLGHPAAYTPHMDRLAERGTLFSQAYCNSPQCCPARASMWSGEYVHQVEAWNNYKGLDPDAPTSIGPATAPRRWARRITCRAATRWARASRPGPRRRTSRCWGGPSVRRRSLSQTTKVEPTNQCTH